MESGEHFIVDVTNNFASGIKGDYKEMPKDGDKGFFPAGFFPTQNIVSKEEVI